MSLALALCLLAAGAAPERPTLAGVVSAQDGQPLADAMVFIYTAKPKAGNSATCPSCYLDCSKKAKTNARGEFEIPSLDPALLFRVGAIAAGHEPAFLANVDPAAAPIRLTLAPRAPLPEDPRRVVRARIVNPEGVAVVGAMVEPIGVAERAALGLSKRFGSIGSGPTITDANGSFALVLKSAADGAYLAVNARGLAPARFDIPTASEERTLTLGRGAAIKGRVVKNGTPLAGVTLGLAQVSRDSETFVGEPTAETDSAGRFLFANVVPGDQLVLYGKILGFGSHGAVPARPIETGAEASVLDVGDLATVPALTLSGRVILSDGKAVPPRTRVMVARMEAWDTAEQELGADGSFRLEGLPREVLSLVVSAPGYGFSPKNGSYLANTWNPRGSIVGRLDTDTTIALLLEPLADLPKANPPRTAEEWKASAQARQELMRREEEIRSQPLRGAPER
jgi:hypothetical protein